MTTAPDEVVARPGSDPPCPDVVAERADLRMPAVGLAAWTGGVLAAATGWQVVVAVAATGLLGAWRRRSRTLAAAVLVLAAVAAAGLLRSEQVGRDPVARLAGEHAVVSAEAVVTSDVRPTRGGHGDQWLLHASVRLLTGRGATYALRSPVLLLADEAWADVPLGARVRLTGRLAPARSGDLAAVVIVSGGAEVLDAPDPWWRGAAAVRRSVRASVQHLSVDVRGLVPALVDGDDSGVSEDLAARFRTTGLTHLLAVSGTNLTLVVGFLLVAARWCGVRGRWHLLVGAAGIVGFVLLARTEPSVVRAAAMGSVALLGLGVDGRRRGPRALGVAVVVLLLLDPRLAVSVGFALSVVATAGILLLAPGLRDSLSSWTPRWLAEAVAVPLAAQLACTPLVTATSGQVSLVAVAANVVVAPVIGPATVLGLGGGLLGLAWAPGGALLGTLAGGCVAWLVGVARRGADLPASAVDWGSGHAALVVLTLLTAAGALLLPRLLRSPAASIASSCVLVVAVVVRVPPPGWPPPGWVLVGCDVGQGDALVLRVAREEAVVVDTGPEPAAVDRCLDRLDVDSVPLVVLTHDHADHVDGLAGVREGRDVDAVATAGQLPYGAVRTFGAATLQVLWPPDGYHAANPNDASVVLLVEVAGLRLLLTGDVEPPAQGGLARAWPGLLVDVVKVPHHGSRYQDIAWLLGLGARVAVVSVGRDNDYGHPSPETLGPLGRAGLEVLRTDTDGDVAVVSDEGGLAVATSR